MGAFKYFSDWLSLAMLLMLSGCLPGGRHTAVVRTVQEPKLSLRTANKKTVSSKNARVVTIWIHGTKGSSRLLPMNAVKTFFGCKSGLHHWYETVPEHHVYRIAKTLIQADPGRFAHEDFYLFGWSGILSFTAREQAAQELYNALEKLIADNQRNGHSLPILRIITHSHGGNVALLLAEVMEAKNHYFPIEELILLACPVQDRTAHLVEHPLFKKVYSIYSSWDLFQIGDPQGAYQAMDTQSFFSRRHFQPHSHLRQVMIKFNGRSLTHIEFILTHFLHLFPAILDEIDAWFQNMSLFVYEPYTLDLVLNIKN